MDVVEADPKDWVRDPFVATQDGGFIFGRGISDNKFDVSMIVATLVALKSQGFQPGRDIHLFLSGDAVLSRTMDRWLPRSGYADFDGVLPLPDQRSHPSVVAAGPMRQARAAC